MKDAASAGPTNVSADAASRRLTSHRTTLKHIHYESPPRFYTVPVCLANVLAYLFIPRVIYTDRVTLDVTIYVTD